MCHTGPDPVTRTASCRDATSAGDNGSQNYGRRPGNPLEPSPSSAWLYFSSGPILTDYPRFQLLCNLSSRESSLLQGAKRPVAVGFRYYSSLCRLPRWPMVQIGREDGYDSDPLCLILSPPRKWSYVYLFCIYRVEFLVERAHLAAILEYHAFFLNFFFIFPRFTYKFT